MCQWNHVSYEQAWRQYNNLDLFDLCMKLKENVYKNYIFIENEQLLNEHINDINCDIFIDKGYNISSIDMNDDGLQILPGQTGRLGVGG